MYQGKGPHRSSNLTPPPKLSFMERMGENYGYSVTRRWSRARRYLSENRVWFIFGFITFACFAWMGSCVHGCNEQTIAYAEECASFCDARGHQRWGSSLGSRTCTCYEAATMTNEHFTCTPEPFQCAWDDDEMISGD